MNKKFLAVAISSGLLLTACGGGSPSPEDPKPIPKTSLSGVINKGIVQNGKVEVCDVFDSSGCNKDQSDFYLETQTNDKGEYQIKGAPQSKPILVYVSKKDSSTKMKCDIAVCDDSTVAKVTFGDSFEVDDDWSLKTILPAAVSGDVIVNVTSLTDLAAEEAFELAGSAQVTENDSRRANSAVQQSFGLTKSITQMGGVDLTDPSALSKADAENIAAATYSAALLKVERSLKLALIDLKTNADSTVNRVEIEKILTDSSSLIGTITDKVNKDLPEEEQVDLTQAQQKIEHTEPPAEVKTGSSEHSDEISKAKEFAQDIRSAFESVQADGELKTGLEGFGDKLNAIDPLISEDSTIIFGNIQDALLAIEETVREQSANPELSSPFKSSNGLSVTFTGNDIGNEAIMQTYSIEKETIKLKATISGTLKDTDGKCEDSASESTRCERSTTKGDVNFDVTINATKNNTTLSGKGSLTLDAEFIEEIIPGEQWLKEERVNSATITLKSTLKNKLNNTEFKGDITLDLIGFKDVTKDVSEFHEENNGDYHSTEYKSEYNNEVSAKSMNLTLKGELTTENSETVDALLDLRFSNPTGVKLEESIIATWRCNDYGYYCDNWTSISTDASSIDTETEENFTKAYVTVKIGTELNKANNEAMPSFVKFESSRENYDEIETTLTINYNDVDTIIEADIPLVPANDDSKGVVETFVIRNTNGVEATLNINSRSGKVEVDDVEVASIEESSHSLMLIRYEDGSFESLF